MLVRGPKKRPSLAPGARWDIRNAIKRLSASLLVAAVCAAAQTGAATAAGPKQDLVSGSGKGFFVTHLVDAPFVQVNLNVKGDETDADGRVLWRLSSPEGDIANKGSVYCVNAVGNVAYVGTKTTWSSFPPLVGSTQTWKVIDNGQASQDEVGLRLPRLPEVPPPPPCPSPVSTVPPPPDAASVDSGNFVVKDFPEPPA